jgi:hypothetical protein
VGKINGTDICLSGPFTQLGGEVEASTRLWVDLVPRFWKSFVVVIGVKS